MSEVMYYACLFTGWALITLLSLGGIRFCVLNIITVFKNRNWEEREHIVRSNLSELKRWCGYEFPHVEQTCDALLNCLNNDRFINADGFRAVLRKKEI